MSDIGIMLDILIRGGIMKKIASLMLGAALFCGLNASFGNLYVAKAEKVEKYVLNCMEFAKINDTQSLQTQGKASYLMDFDSQTVIYAKNERERLPIASMCKIMTLLLSFEALEREDFKLDDEICISERAASMGGSQVFLEAHAKYPVKELIKSIIVCSANDSCVAMAEKISGSENIFVEKMNEKAKELGCTDTLFANCTGLPKEPQYSCAKDVAIMLKSLLNHELYFELGKVWMDKFEHPGGRYTEITNTNKLVRFYDGCDGGKTGFTNEAGFCLAATAKRDNMRVISVVIGEKTSGERFDDVRTMFDYAFANYTVVPIFQSKQPLEEKVYVNGGKKESIGAYPQRDVFIFVKRGEKGDVTFEKRIEPLRAPIKKEDKIGELILFRDGVELKRVDLLAKEDVKAASVMDRLKKIARNWNG